MGHLVHLGPYPLCEPRDGEFPRRPLLSSSWRLFRLEEPPRLSSSLDLFDDGDLDLLLSLLFTDDLGPDDLPPVSSIPWSSLPPFPFFLFFLDGVGDLEFRLVGIGPNLSISKRDDWVVCNAI